MGSDAAAQSDLKSIVVAGEFNAGKSSVINLLLRREVQNASVDYSMMPPTLIFPSGTESLKLVTTSGEKADTRAFREGEIDGDDLAEAEIGTDFGDLEGATITEVSVGLNGKLDARSRYLMEHADVLIWCTMGQRAWALTEISVVKELPPKVHENAILAMTRADYLRDEEKRALVKKRLDKQAAEFFATILQVTASRKAVQEAGSDASWAEAGGRALHDAVLAALPKAGGDAPAGDAAAAAAEEVSAAPAQVEDYNPAAIEIIWINEIAGFVKWLKSGSGSPAPEDVVHRLNAVLHRVIEAYNSDLYAQISMEDRTRRLELAQQELQETLKTPVSDDDAVRSLDLVLQLEEETLIWSKDIGIGAIANADESNLFRAS